MCLRGLAGVKAFHTIKLTSLTTGIIPHSGRQITYKQLADGIQNTYNLSPTLAKQLTASAMVVDNDRGYIDLKDLNTLNVRFPDLTGYVYF